MGVRVVAVGAPDALRGQTVSVGGTGVGQSLPVCGGTEFGAGARTAAGGVRAGTVDGWLEWRTGLGAGIGVVGGGAGKWTGWAGGAGGAERLREGVGAYGAAGEGG